LGFKTTSIFVCEQVGSILGWFESLLHTPTTILGTPAEAGVSILSPRRDSMALEKTSQTFGSILQVINGTSH
jgi:hypothetical protein